MGQKKISLAIQKEYAKLAQNYYKILKIDQLKHYPENGKHLEIEFIEDYEFLNDIFEIRKGENGYSYTNIQGEKLEYNLWESDKKFKVTKEWIFHWIHADDEDENVFASEDLNFILDYCLKQFVVKTKQKRNKLEIQQNLIQNVI